MWQKHSIISVSNDFHELSKGFYSTPPVHHTPNLCLYPTMAHSISSSIFAKRHCIYHLSCLFENLFHFQSIINSISEMLLFDIYSYIHAYIHNDNNDRIA